jgi:ribosome-associated toxin RatA of RatAB toxin-antitoxin module
MYTFEKTEQLEIPLTIAYQVASGIENYHEFIYGMKPVDVLTKGNDYITVTFKSRLLGGSVQMTAQFKKDKSIHFIQADGPFKELSGHWIFDGNEEGVLVTFSTIISHKNFIIDKTLRVLGSEFCDRVIKDFKKQADQIIQQTAVNFQEKQIIKDI